MKRNIFIKTALRQPIRNLILAILIGAAAFAFISRAVEYIAVTSSITQIEKNYRSIGYLFHHDFIPSVPEMGQVLPPVNDVNTVPAAEIIGASPYIEYEDRRRFVQGILPDDMTNANFVTFGMPISDIQSIDYVYFYAYFDRAAMGGNRPDGTRSLYIHFDMDYFVAGYEEFFVPDEQVRLIWLVTEDMLPDRA